MASLVITDFNYLKTTSASTNSVDELTVLDIGGNKFGLIAAIHSNRRKVGIRHVLTHTEYDLNAWKKRRQRDTHLKLFLNQMRFCKFGYHSKN